MVITNGTIIDGSGQDRYLGDVYLEGGKIIKIVKKEQPGKADTTEEVIDATGKYVLPGLIDMHSHADATMAGFPGMENYLAQGITTLSVGHCGMGVAPIDRFYKHEVIEDRAFMAIGEDGPDGFSPYDVYIVPTESLRAVSEETLGYKMDWSTFGEYMEHMKRETFGCNIRPMVSFGTIRLQVMGLDCKRPATEEEMKQMETMLHRELKSGARGVHFGADYLPDGYASPEELLRMAECLKPYDGLLDVHTQNTPERGGQVNPDYRCIDGIREILEIGLKADVRTNISHLVTNWPSPELNEEESEEYMYQAGKEILSLIEDYEKKGLRVSFDVIPPGCMCILTDSTPELASLFLSLIKKENGMTRFFEKLKEKEYRDWIRHQVEKGCLDGICNIFPPYRRFLKDPDGVNAGKTRVLKSVHPEWEGKNFGELEEMWQTDGLATVFKLLLADPHVCVQFYKAAGSTETKTDRMYIRHRLSSIGFDSTAADRGCNIAPKDYPLNACPPGNFNAMIDYLNMDILERFEDRVYKASGRSAEILGFKDRGLLKEGYAADVVVLDPENLRSHRDYAVPWTLPEGIEYVFVNGKVAVEKGILTKSRAGEIL